jgi:hypothetical protein
MIDPTDSIISLTNKKPVKPTDAFINRVNKLDKVYRDRVRNWILSQKREDFSGSKVNYEDAIQYIETDMETIANLYKGWESQEELTLEYINKLDSLKLEKPINQSVTLFGTEDIPPSKFEQDKWLIYYKIFQNPTIILDKLESGVLGGSDIYGLNLLYPSILDHIQEVLIESIVELRNTNITNLGGEKMRLVNIILQVPRLSPDKLLELQQQYTKQEKSIDITPVSVQTDTQRVEHK